MVIKGPLDIDTHLLSCLGYAVHLLDHVETLNIGEEHGEVFSCDAFSSVVREVYLACVHKRTCWFCMQGIPKCFQKFPR